MATARINGWGEPIEQVPVTLPPINLPEADHTEIDAELAARL